LQETLRKLPCLHHATRSQRDINMPLDTLDTIPAGFGVPDEEDLRGHEMREIPEDAPKTTGAVTRLRARFGDISKTSQRRLTSELATRT
jgi:transcriptional regulator of met regulon